MNDDPNARRHLIGLWKKSRKELTLDIQGTSMRPLIVEGNTISCVPLSEKNDIKIGDIVVFEGETTLIAHRIIGAFWHDGQPWYLEKGDNKFYPTRIPASEVIGRVRRIYKNDQNGSVIDLRRWYWVTINRCLGCYWKLLFCLLEALQVIKSRFLGSMPLSFIGRFFRKVVAVAIKLPMRLFR